MFTINIKGKQNKKDEKSVKLEMIFYQPGYNRVSKVLDITGPFQDWDNEKQCFISGTREASLKNITLYELKQKYQSIAEEWELTGVKWSPIQLSQHFDEKKSPPKTNVNVLKNKVLSVSKVIDELIKIYEQKERIKNGKIVVGSSNVKDYQHLKNSLISFTQKKYERNFSMYYFKDIDEEFVKDYMLYLQKRGLENGNKGAVVNRLKKLRAVCSYADKYKMPGVDMTVFECVKNNMKHDSFESKAIPFEIIKKIEDMDKSSFSRIERFHIDVFLFSFYTGGMANIDVCFLNWSCIKENMINYERMKFPKKAKVPLIDKAREIIKKYDGKCCKDYVLPIFTNKQVTEIQKHRKVEAFSWKLNNTLKKVQKTLKCRETFTWYSARGSFITKMINEGYHPITVAEHAGNSPDMIYKHYYKTTNPDMLLQSMNKLL